MASSRTNTLGGTTMNRHCSQCGQPFNASACGPTHAIVAMQIGHAENLARRFHETYERLAPSFGYETRKDSAVPWEAVPEQNRALMVAVALEIVQDGLYSPPAQEAP